MASSNTEVGRCEFNSDGRIVAGGYPRQIDLRRVADGRRLAQLPVGGLPIFAFDPLGEAIITSDSRGVACRPMREQTPGQMELDPPWMILPGPRWRSVAYSGDGRWFFAANAFSNQVYVFDRSLTNCIASFGPHEGVDRLVASFDGRLVVTGDSVRRDVRVWDVESKTDVLAAKMGRQSEVTLSPDGKWLLVHGDRLELREIATGKQAPPLPDLGTRPMTGAACFSHDSQVLALVVDQYEVQLFDLLAWKALGRLRGPRETRISALAFSRDGSWISAATSQGRLRVWNMAQIRHRLAELDLDWENPRFPMSHAGGPTSGAGLEIIQVR